MPSCQEPKLDSAIDDVTYQDYLFRLQESETCRQIVINQLKNFQTETDFYWVRFVG